MKTFLIELMIWLVTGTIFVSLCIGLDYVTGFLELSKYTHISIGMLGGVFYVILFSYIMDKIKSKLDIK
jgi:hypothetical protein